MSILTDLNPQALLAKIAIAGIVVVVSASTGGYFAYKYEKSAYDAYVSKQAAASTAQVLSNKTALDQQAAAFKAQIDAIQKDHANEISQISSARDAALADSAVYAGRLRQYLSRPGVRPAGMPEAAASTGGANATGASQLSDGVSDLNWYLTNQFSLADTIAATLNEAEQVIAKDREVCNGSLPGITK